MRKSTTLMLGLSALALAGSTLAGTASIKNSLSSSTYSPWYVSAGLGFSAAHTDTWRNKSNGGNINSVYKSGYDSNAAFGYRFNRYWRTELQFQYINNDISRVKWTGFNQKMDGYSRSWAGMANVYFDWANSTRFTPYVGVGAGYNVVKFHNKLENLTPADNDTGFVRRPAIQAILGVNYRISTHWLVGANYTYFYALSDNSFNFIDRDTSPSTAVPYKNTSYQRNLFNLNVTYQF